MREQVAQKAMATSYLDAKTSYWLADQILHIVFAWGNETCPHDLFGEGTQCFKHACDECWQELGHLNKVED